MYLMTHIILLTEQEQLLGNYLHKDTKGGLVVKVDNMSFVVQGKETLDIPWTLEEMVIFRGMSGSNWVQ